MHSDVQALIVHLSDGFGVHVSVARPLELKEDVLRCTTTELSYGLCRFTMEVKRPNGEPYLPDSLFYLCLGIQQVRTTGRMLCRE